MIHFGKCRTFSLLIGIQKAFLYFIGCGQGLMGAHGSSVPALTFFFSEFLYFRGKTRELITVALWSLEFLNKN